MKKIQIGFQEAFRKTLTAIRPLPPVKLLISDAQGHVAAETLSAKVDSPSLASSLKDGYALRCQDVASALAGETVTLPISGFVAAGQIDAGKVKSGTAVRILTGAPLPAGADTVVAEEFVDVSGDLIAMGGAAEKGRNILQRGSDIASGDTLIKNGEPLTPGNIGLLAAGGHRAVNVFQRPRVALIATGDEVLLPGQTLTAGKLYASNLLTLHSWCRRFGFPTHLDVIGDDFALLKGEIGKTIGLHDAMITSGGAWTGDKDMMAKVLDDLGWQQIYHRVRLGPGKAVGFGLLDHKPVFILPGGPPSNLIAFLELALPGLLRLCGFEKSGLTEMPAVLERKVSGQVDWTQAIFGDLTKQDHTVQFRPHDLPSSRLKSMAEAQGVLLIPEGVSEIQAGEMVNVQILDGV